MPPRSRKPEETDEPTPTDPTSESPSPQPDPIPSSPLFSESRSQEPLPQLTEPESSPSLGGSAESAAADPGTPSAPRSTGSGARARFNELRKTAKAAVKTAGGMAHQLLTRDGTPERKAELWLPDQDDLDDISEPLASLASRRMPEGAENPDVTDLIRLGAALLTYVFKQRGKAAEIQRDYNWEPPAEPGQGQREGDWVEVAEPVYP